MTAGESMLDCMVNYFSYNDNSDGTPRRYYCYLVVAGPGPSEDAGVATITTLAVHEGDRPCDYCQHCFFAHRGGPEAALTRALRYLDSFHEGQHLRKVVSQTRRMQGWNLPGQEADEPILREPAEKGRRDDPSQPVQGGPRIHRPEPEG